MDMREARCHQCGRLFFLEPEESEGALCCICKRDAEYLALYGPDWRRIVRSPIQFVPLLPTPLPEATVQLMEVLVKLAKEACEDGSGIRGSQVRDLELRSPGPSS